MSTDVAPVIRIPGSFVPILRAEAREQIRLSADLQEREPAQDSEQREDDASIAHTWELILSALEDDGTLRDRMILADSDVVGRLRDTLRDHTRERLSDVLYEETGPGRAWVPAAFDGWCVVMDQLDRLVAP